jgi:hypothetical protein
VNTRNYLLGAGGSTVTRRVTLERDWMRSPEGYLTRVDTMTLVAVPTNAC